MAEPLRQHGDETEPTLAWICDGLVRHLAGQGAADRLFRTYRLLANHLLERLPKDEAQRLRQSPEERRGTLTALVAASLRDDVRTRQLVAVLLTPPGNVSRSAPRRDDKLSRILFLSSQSNRQEAIRIAEEERQIRHALLGARYGRQLEIIVGSAVRVRDFPWYLLEYDPDILHFSGHGYQGAILVENDGEADWPLEGCRLAELFGIFKNRLRCVVLNSCHSGMEAEPIAREVGAAVVRPGAVSDQAAIIFSEHFYEGLGYGRTLRHAFDLGCWGVNSRGIGALPQLLGEAREIRFVSEDES
jgi:hypothetical protein